LLDEGEHATVHGPPTRAAELLAHALDVALDAGDQAGGARARWLLGDDDWRIEVRTGWVAAELALLEGRPADAARAAAAAAARAERAAAAPYVAKSLLFQGVAQVQGGDAAAADTLSRAASLAELLGAHPLVWPARALLGAVLARSGQATEATMALSAARDSVDAIAAGIDEDASPRWLAQPAVAAVLAATAAPS
jgi:hypothetical protein